MTNAINKTALLAAMEAEGIDQSKADAGGGKFELPAAGPVQLRFFAYIELGKHSRVSMGKEKKDLRCVLGFELSGPNHPPRDDGKPQVMFKEMTASNFERAVFHKTFSRMNHAGKAKHIIALLGESFLGKIHHSVMAAKGNFKERTVASLDSAPGEPLDIGPCSFTHPVTGAVETVSVAPLRTPEMVFLFDRPDLDQWASIFIDGEYPERKDDKGNVTAPAKSKNVYQARIMKALNFKGSAVETMLVTNGKPLDIPNAEDPEDTGEDAPINANEVLGKIKDGTPTGAAAADALNGVV